MSERAKLGPCKFNGRRLIELASGAAASFAETLKALSHVSCGKAVDSMRALQQMAGGGSVVQEVAQMFSAGKAAMLLRFEQASSFYMKYPWSLPRLLKFTLLPEDSVSVLESRAFAQELLDLHAQKKLPSGTFGDKFFQPPMLEALKQWAGGGSQIDNELLKELLGYGLALTVMQRLESKHHLVHQRASVARAGSAAYHSANLRRKQNQDVLDTGFRLNLESYLQRFDELVPEEWSSKSELAKLVSGHHLSIMFADTAAEESITTALPPRPHADNALVFQEHLKMTLRPGCHYAVPTCNGVTTTYAIIQVVDTRPSGKKYMQRVMGWSEDQWHDAVGVLTLGNHVAAGAVAGTEPLPLPPDFKYECGQGTLEPLQLSVFFKHNFECVYKLSAWRSSKFSMDSIHAVMDVEGSLETTIDASTL